MQAKQLIRFAWGLSTVVTILAVLVWLDANNGRLTLHAFTLFPVLGLTAFSLMWVHYIIGAMRRYYGIPKQNFKQYYEITSAIVLIAILLHPGLLILQLWRSGFGLPPNSYLNYYVAPAARWAAALGSISLLVFLAFELRRRFETSNWWKWLERSQILAMIAIYIHALRLGGELQVSWYRGVWFVYGITFVSAIIYLQINESKKIEVRQ